MYKKEQVNIPVLPHFASIVYGRWTYVAKFYKAHSELDIQKFITAFYDDLVIIQFNMNLYIHLPSDLTGDMIQKVILFC